MLEYKIETERAKQIFESKFKEYGDSYKYFRSISLIEQIEMKMIRIVNIQNNIKMLNNEVGDDIESEFLGVYNYVIQYLLREIVVNHNFNSDYDYISDDIYQLMLKKNHDYGSAWENMHIWTLTDLMRVKLVRIKNMLLKIMSDKSIDSSTTEGVESNIKDIANYAIFCLILIARNRTNYI